MNVQGLQSILNPYQYYIVVYNIDAYAEGITGRNYNMKVYCLDADKRIGWDLKKELSAPLNIVKKMNKSYSEPASTKGQFNTIKVMKLQDMLEEAKVRPLGNDYVVSLY